MRARHVTSEKDYRDPFGAARLGGTVTISIDVWGDDVVFCTLRIWTDAHGEEFIEMKGTALGDRTRYAATYTPVETGIVWYSFDIESTDGSVWRYGTREGWTTGEGAFAYGDPPSFQITVYEPRENQPMRAGESAAAELDVVQPQIAGADAKLIGRIRQLVNDRAAVLFAVPDRGSRESLELRLNDESIPFVESLGAAAENSVPVIDPAATRDVAPLRRGFVTFFDAPVPAGIIIPTAGIGVLSISDLTARTAKNRRRARRVDPTSVTFPFKPGDYVVHDPADDAADPSAVADLRLVMALPDRRAHVIPRSPVMLSDQVLHPGPVAAAMAQSGPRSGGYCRSALITYRLFPHLFTKLFIIQ